MGNIISFSLHKLGLNFNGRLTIISSGFPHYCTVGSSYNRIRGHPDFYYTLAHVTKKKSNSLLAEIENQNHADEIHLQTGGLTGERAARGSPIPQRITARRT